MISYVCRLLIVITTPVLVGFNKVGNVEDSDHFGLFSHMEIAWGHITEILFKAVLTERTHSLITKVGEQ